MTTTPRSHRLRPPRPPHAPRAFASLAAGIALVALLTPVAPLHATALAPAPRPSIPDSRFPIPEPCSPASGSAPAILARAEGAAGITRMNGRVLRYEFSDDISQDYQSDRTYPPYLTAQWGGMFYIDPATRVQRLEERMFGMGYHAEQPFVLLHGARSTYVVRDTALVPNARGHALSLRSRPLDAWTVLADWSASSDARVVARCTYRDFPRIVLERTTRAGPERLFLDPKSGLPVKLDRREPHYLWGDVHAEYVWTNWKLLDGVSVPLAAYRLEDGAVEIARSVGLMALVPRDSAPAMALPADAPDMPVHTPHAPPPDTVRLGATAFLLRHVAYTDAVVLARDTVWVLDAPMGEYRARQDAEWIARLFPGHHPVAVVVGDLAWPHIAGVRYWVARGATVYSHPMSRAFLERVVARRWTLDPDTLERVRRAHPAAARLRFRAIADSLPLAGGALTAYAINGLGSEGALMTWLPGERFLWAGDYVQELDEPTTYANEVIAATRRAGIAPERVAAMHLPLTAWSAVLAANPGDAAPASAPGAR